MEKLLQLCVELLEAGEAFALAVVVESQGSAPRGAGAMMAVRRDGSIAAGTVGGGSLEARAIDAGRAVLEDGGGALLPFDLTNADAAKSDMICGGRGRLAVVRAAPGDLPVFAAALEAARTGGHGFLVLSWPREDGGAWSLSFAAGGEGGGVYPAPGGGERCLLPIHDGGRLLIFGAGHVSREIAALARHLGFRVTVMDDRAEYASAQRFPDCDVRVLSDMDRPPAMSLDGDDYVVVATRGHMHDLNCLEWALRTGAGYIGMIGSRRKKGLVFAEMEARGIAPAALAEVRTPIGLDIRAQTPAEIAVSVAAELIETRAQRRGADA